MIIKKIKKKINLILALLLLLMVFIYFFNFYNEGLNLENQHNEEMVSVKEFGDSGLHYIELNQKAVTRLGIEIFEVGEDDIESSDGEKIEDDEDEDEDEGEENEENEENTVIPYSAIAYGNNGKVWVYTSPDVRKYLRREVEIKEIDGNEVVLTERLPNIKIVSVGVTELLGIEFGVGGGH